MKDLVEQMYCSQQINIPPNLPFILKQYAKAAIRTQPYDLLYWSLAYFQAKAENLPLPVKERLEYPPVHTRSRLTPGFLKVLHKQLGHEASVKVSTIYKRWQGVCLQKEALDSLLKLGRFQSSEIEWLKFLAIAAGHLCPALSQTMILICETITEEPEGGSAMIPVDTFVWLYTFLAQMDCGPKPPESIQSDVTVNTLVEPPENFDSVSPVTSTDVKGDVEKEYSLCDMTSQDGLMVWPDIVPSEKSVHHRSAGSPSDEGLTSEHGVVAFTESADDIQTIKYQQLQTRGREEPSQYTLIAESIEPRPNESHMTGMHDESSTYGSDDKDTFIEKEQTTNSELAEKPSDITDEGNKSSHQNGSIQVINNSQYSSSEVSPSSQVEKKGYVNETDEIKNTVLLHNQNDSNETQLKTMFVESETKVVNKDSNLLHIESSVSSLKNGTEGKYMETSSSGHSTEIEKQSSLSLGSNKLFQTLAESSEESHLAEESSKFDDSIILTGEPYWEHVPGIGPVVPEHQLTAVVEYMRYWAAKQVGMVMPRNVKHFLCPPLDAEIPATDDTSSN